MKSPELRQLFLEFFRARGHEVVPGIPLVPPEDPTLLFTSAGMVPFKNYWAGSGDLPYARAVSVQKCLRAGGKDSDLENVGLDSRHHTFFEMLGNFSFGDYFKEEAIGLAWRFLLDELRLDSSRLLASVYEEDEEALAIWARIMPREKIFKLGVRDNFWGPAGETGVCGPSSEIYFDRGERFSCGRPDCRPGCDCERFLEIWNLVFPQFNKGDDGTLRPLARPGIDTGMGLERICAVMQGCDSNFETDLFAPIIGAMEKITGLKYGSGTSETAAFRVAADHVRALSFAIGENILPGNEGRGYVIRRILRRAVKFLHAVEVRKPLLGQLVPEVTAVMKSFYPYLGERRRFIEEMITREEERYLSLLREGRGIFMSFSGEFEGKTVPGGVAFRLYDTHGLPLDVIRELAAAEGLVIDERGYRKQLEQRKDDSRRVGGREELPADRGRLVGLAPTRFTGYENLETESTVQAVIPPAPEPGRKGGGGRFSLVLAETPFYPERGGQVGDRGIISGPEFEFEVQDTLIDESGFIHHLGVFSRGRAEGGQSASARVDEKARNATAANHTATHLLHDALRRTLGDEARQAGSLVTPENLRFDFTFSGSLPDGFVRTVEAMVNEAARASFPVSREEKTLAQAVEEGALALFGEKYGDRVRVVSTANSREVCGGTHLDNTGRIGLFIITGVSSIGRGVRRVEALTGAAAWRWVRDRCDYLDEVARTLKVEPMSLAAEIARREAEKEETAARAAAYRPAWSRQEAEKIMGSVRRAGPVGLAVSRQPLLGTGEARQLLDILREKGTQTVFLIMPGPEERTQFLLGLSRDLVSAGWNARDLLREAARRLGGGAGGRADFAQAGFKKPVRAADAEEIMRAAIAARASGTGP